MAALLSTKLLALVLLLLVHLARPQAVSQPFPCLRWAQQTTVASGQESNDQTLWIYGGQARTSIGQAENTWTNALLKLDLAQPWSTSNPPVELIQAKSNASNTPPQVALGALWSSKDGNSLYQYNGQFSDTPPANPTALHVWEYDIKGNKWSTITTSGDSVNRVAEGAGALVPNAGTNGDPMAFYFGGHEDVFTVPNWPGARVYLSSMTSFDFGSSTWKNMSTFATSGNSGSRNSTNSNSPPILRADATLTYVPNLGTDNKGVLVSIGGGNDNQMIDSAVLDVYDIGSGAFVKQATQGQIMSPRVNHCAVRGSAIVGNEEQHMIYVYGGQASNRSTQLEDGQSTDLYILTLPSYTWTYVGANLASQPTARAGHTCELLGDQMVVVGGYISEDILCEQPGIYVMNTTSLSWSTSYTPGTSFTTPDLLRNITGGTGTSNSTGGSGWSNPNNDFNPASAVPTSTQSGATATVTADPAKTQQDSSKSKLGPVLGGVVGGLFLLFLVALLVNFFAKRQRRRERQRFQTRLLGQDRYTWSMDEDEDDAASLRAMAYTDTAGATRAIPLTSPHDGIQRTPMYASQTSVNTTNSSRDAPWSNHTASDDVENDTEGMVVSGMTHLSPREQLRVMNPTANRSRSSLGYSATQRSAGSL